MIAANAGRIIFGFIKRDLEIGAAEFPETGAEGESEPPDDAEGDAKHRDADAELCRKVERAEDIHGIEGKPTERRRSSRRGNRRSSVRKSVVRSSMKIGCRVDVGGVADNFDFVRRSSRFS